MPIPAGVVGVSLMSAAVAHFNMPSEVGRSAHLERMNHTRLLIRDYMRIIKSVAA